MNKNMGTIDRILRLVVAIVFVALYATDTVVGAWGAVLLLIAVIFTLTSLVSVCPLYLPFGLNTLRKKLQA